MHVAHVQHVVTSAAPKYLQQDSQLDHQANHALVPVTDTGVLRQALPLLEVRLCIAQTRQHLQPNQRYLPLDCVSA